MVPDLTCDLLGLRLRNPIVLASGVLGTSAALLIRAARAGAGAVTSKSCGPGPRAGHANPVAVDWGHGVINAIGLSNPGAEEEAEMLLEARAGLEVLGVPLIASIFAGTVAEYGAVARIVAGAQPDLIEVNISCPNVESRGQVFACEVMSASSVIHQVCRNSSSDVPIFAKLTPDVTSIAEIALACHNAGADGLSVMNTTLGMAIDPDTLRPILGGVTGGLSGPAIRPMAVRCVWQIHQVLPDVSATASNR